MSLAESIAAAILASLVAYAITAGADFGGGVWDLLARGERREAQRKTIANAIGPIWEANHVWMIIAVTLLFSAFPPAFAEIMTYLHVPVSLFLVGIVLRGSAFIFRKVDPMREGGPSGWQKVFAVSSVITPVMLGVVLGALSTPALGSDPDFFTSWTGPFPWAVGAFTLALFAYLAATYLTLETGEVALVEDFRRRALGAAAAVGFLAPLVAFLAFEHAPYVAEHLSGSWGGRLTVGAGAACLLVGILALLNRRYQLARAAAAGATVMILAGWGFGIHPWLVVDSLTIEQAAAPPITLRLVGGALLGGTVLLLPAYAYLMHTFKVRGRGKADTAGVRRPAD